MNVHEEERRFSSENVQHNVVKCLDPVDFFIVTRVPVETYKFKWSLSKFNNISNDEELYSFLYSSCYRMKLTKYENGFGLFHLRQTRHNHTKQTVNNLYSTKFDSSIVHTQNNNKQPFGSSVYSLTPLTTRKAVRRVPRKDDIAIENTAHSAIKNQVVVENENRIEYQVSALDKHGKERIRWETCFSNKNDNESCLIGEYRSNSWKTFSSDDLVLHCCIKVTKTPKTEKQYLDTECYLGSRCWLKLSQDLKSMYKNSFNADCTLQIGTEEIRVNSSILAARSSVFKKMLNHDKEQNVQSPVIITDVPLPAIKRLVEFLYTGAVEDAAKDNPFEEVYDLYYAADKYKVMDLRKICGINLISKASVNNASKILMLADQHSDNYFKSQVLNFIRLNFEAVVDSDIWRHFMENETKLANEALSFCAQKFKAGV
ncbi:speckle-type POZ protein B [Trichonephila inaurata madagascariensis]|uniref:Speckle-type POZ protein B n=1 Tax=Trichonephila inaurata madagascariensis TaxID=2747483 RepID=A0A8X7C3R7_9ARAC|nr:speckle-type POZ protein B [Trichonephila inaurata madagascariensis]